MQDVFLTALSPLKVSILFFVRDLVKHEREEFQHLGFHRISVQSCLFGHLLLHGFLLDARMQFKERWNSQCRVVWLGSFACRCGSHSHSKVPQAVKHLERHTSPTPCLHFSPPGFDLRRTYGLQVHPPPGPEGDRGGWTPPSRIPPPAKWGLDRPRWAPVTK